MKKAFISLISLVLILMMVTGCTGTPEPPPDGGQLTPETPGGQPSDGSYLNGVELSNFSVVYSTADRGYSLRAAQYICSQILERTGIELEIVSDVAQSVSEYEIVVGETGRDISERLDADTERSQFAILSEQKQIALEGDYFIIAAAAYFFIDTYVPEDNFSATIPMQVCVHEPIVEKANNYIFLIGDGMGLYQTLLFDVMSTRESYSDKEDVFYGYYLPYVGLARTNSLSGTTDSAAAGTALATGYKTYNGYIGQDSHHRTTTSLTELAASLGKSTAVMSTEVQTGATPAAFSAHTNSRSNSDEIKADQQKLSATKGTIIDCGYDYYTGTIIETLRNKIRTTLDTLDNNEKGFFLMYEEAHIDKHCHDNDMLDTFKAVQRFNQAIAVFVEYAFYNPDTFVIITADHETGCLLPNSSGGYSYNSDDHSSHNVPVFAFGDGASLFGDCIVENVQIPQTIASFMGNANFGDQSKYKPLNK